MTRPYVIDLYHGDPVDDFNAVRNSGIVGVIHKCTEATGYVDPLYARRRQAFLDAGLVWGAYHFFHGDGIREADHFLSKANPNPQTLLALDWETTAGGYTPTAAQAKAFLTQVFKATGQRSVVYSGHAAKEKITGKDNFFGSHRLWLAQYSTSWSCQASWDAPWLWQNNGDNNGPGPHHIPGVRGYCDNSTIVRGTVAGLLSQWGHGPPLPIPSPAPEPSLLSGKGSVYSQFNGKYKWVDTGDAPGSNALGVPDAAQGVSFYNHGTLGRWFEVHHPNGYVSIEQQTDIGPSPRTGRLIDISAAAAERAGYSPQNFPTDSIWKWRAIAPPASVASLSQWRQAVEYLRQRSQLAKD